MTTAMVMIMAWTASTPLVVAAAAAAAVQFTSVVEEAAAVAVPSTSVVEEAAAAAPLMSVVVEEAAAAAVPSISVVEEAAAAAVLPSASEAGLVDQPALALEQVGPSPPEQAMVWKVKVTTQTLMVSRRSKSPTMAIWISMETWIMVTMLTKRRKCCLLRPISIMDR